MSLAALLKATGAAVADPDDDTGQNIPEAPATLAAQARAVAEGRQRAIMVPRGTQEPALPRGFARVETPRGVFHYDPAQIDADTITAASEAGRENEVLGLGPVAKADVLARARFTGEPVAAVVERQPDGVEVKAAVATPSTAPAALRELNARAAPENRVQVESVPEVLAGREKNAARGGGLAALLAATGAASNDAAPSAGPAPSDRPGFFGGVANSARRGVSQAGNAIDGATLGLASGLADDADREPERVAAERAADAEPTREQIARVWGNGPAADRAYASALRKWQERERLREERLAGAARYASGVRGSLAPALSGAIGSRLADIEALPASAAFQKWNDAQGIGEALAVLARHPVEVIANLAAESLPASAPSLAAGTVGSVGGPVGVAAGTGLGSLVTEYGAKIVEELQTAGVDFAEPSTLAALMQDRERFAAIRAKATARGVPVATFDAISAGIAGKLVSQPARGALRKLAAGAVEIGAQAALGGAGEAAGAVAAGDDIDGKAVLAEMLGEVGPGSVEIASGAVRSRVAPSEATTARHGLARLLAETQATATPAPSPDATTTAGAATDTTQAAPASGPATTAAEPPAVAEPDGKTPLGDRAELVAEQIAARPPEDFRPREAIADAGFTGPDADLVTQLTRWGDLSRPDAVKASAEPETFEDFATRAEARFGERVRPYLTAAWLSGANGERVRGHFVTEENPLALESSFRRALNFGRLFWEGSADVLRRSGLRSLASAVEQHTDATDRNLARAWAPVGAALAPFRGVKGLARRSEFKQALATFESFHAAREDGRDADAARILAEATPEARALVEAVAQAMAYTGAENRRLGVRVKERVSVVRANVDPKDYGLPDLTDPDVSHVILNPTTDTGAYQQLQDDLRNGIARMVEDMQGERITYERIRPIGELGGRYFPRIVKPEVAEVLRDPSANPARWREMQNELLASGLIKNRSEAAKYLRTAAPAEDGEARPYVTRGDRFAPLAVARGARMPSAWLRTDFGVVGDYLARWAERAAQVEAFGQKIAPDDLDAFDVALRSVKDKHLAAYVEKTRAAAYRVNAMPKALRAALGNVTAATTALFMGNPYSTFRNLVGGGAQTTNQVGLWRSAVALRDAWRAAAQADAASAGALKADVADLLFQTEGSNVMRNAAGLALKVNGFSAVETFVRSHNYLAARAFLRDALAAMHDRPGSRRAAQAVAFLRRHGIDPDKVEAEAGSGPETDRFLRDAVRQTQGSYRYSQVPLFSDSPVGRFIWQFYRWGAMATRFHAKHVLAPAIVGDVVTVRNADGTTTRRRVRTLAPLIRAPLVTMAAGAATYAVREAALGIARTDQTWDEIFAALSEDEQRGVELALGRMFSDITMGGTFGMVSSWADTLRWAIKTGEPRSPVEPPALGLASEIVAFGRKAHAQRGELSAQDWRQFVGRVVSAYRVNTALAYTFAERFGAEWDAAERHRAEQDRRFARAVGRRFAEARGLPPPTPPPEGVPAVSRRSVLFDALEDALHEGDAAAVEAVVGEALAGIRSDALRVKVRARLRDAALRRAPMTPAGRQDAATREDFREWLRDNLSEPDRLRIEDAQRRFIMTAVRGGLLRPADLERYADADPEDAE
jgi:hypothetical protein